MFVGSAGLAFIYFLLGSGYFWEVSGWPMLLLVVLAIACYAMSLAPVVLCDVVGSGGLGGFVGEIPGTDTRDGDGTLYVFLVGRLVPAYLYLPDFERGARRSGQRVSSGYMAVSAWRDFFSSGLNFRRQRAKHWKNWKKN